ncbi:hypothetical protein C1M56_06510 [Vibrio diazotrophicus]|jgi:membrane protease YdiL (CAAX protease family)|nr:hypothetical protein C1M56_06510 [Vibrio diazotrophicus]
MFKIAILIIYIAVSASPLAGHLFFSIYDSSEILGQYDFNVLSLYWQITVELSRVALAIILFGALLNDDNPAVPSLKMLITLVTLFFALSIAVSYFSIALGYTLDPNYILKKINNFEPMFENNGGLINWLSVLKAAFLFCVLLPTLEEVIFRGYLLKQFLTKFGLIISIFISSLCFALLHQDILHVFVMSCVLGWVFYKFGLGVSIVTHCIHNLTLLVVNVLYFEIEGNYALPSMDTSPYLPSIPQAIAILFLVIFSKYIYRSVIK